MMARHTGHQYRSIAIIVAILVAAASGYGIMRAHREAAHRAAITKELDRLSTPAPRRAGVSLRPDGR